MDTSSEIKLQEEYIKKVKKINQDKNECFILAVDLMEVPSIIKKILSTLRAF